MIVSMYAPWTRPIYASTGSGWIVSDASAHRAVSDLSAFIGSQHGHRIIAAGDLNILHGHGEHDSVYWAGRYGTVFSKMDALGLSFAGPQAPHGRQADPWPDELPPDSNNIPTYHSVRETSGNRDPSTGLRLRVQGPCRVCARAGPQRAEGMGTERLTACRKPMSHDGASSANTLVL